MPTYQYACTACDHAFDQVQSFSEPSLTECPQCAGRVRKVYNAVGVVFKGSGFYRNDSRSANKSDTTTATPSKSETGAKSDSSAGSSTSDSGSSSASGDTKSSTTSSKSESSVSSPA